MPQEKTVDFTLQITEYIPNAMHSQVEGEPDEWLDATRVQIEGAAAGKNSFLIYHNQPAIEESFWRKKGLKLKVQVSEALFTPKEGSSIQIFADAFKIMEILDKTEDFVYREIRRAGFFIRNSRKQCGCSFNEKKEREKADKTYWQRNYFCEKTGVYLRAYLFHNQKEALAYAENFMRQAEKEKERLKTASGLILQHRFTVNGALLYIVRGDKPDVLSCLVSFFSGEE